ncbi:MAG TPA: dTDP-4-dehydrorhamnose 3,5-epimerase [Gammaproteobacteria bacterium]|nr:dTDP-4-dehydrorhamnose 3,5-epimerase [Gammaproteobacteria bacterium]
MIFTESELKGAFIIEPEKLTDTRGFFARSWCQREFAEHGLNTNLVQANIAFNNKAGTLRGMHRQVAPHEEAKLVRCTRGALYDVIIDLRPDSSTCGRWLGVELNQDNHKMLYVPEGFAHGYLTLTDDCEIFYLVSEFYTPGAEKGVRWDDPAFGIKWPEIPDLLISEKDQAWPDYK